MEENYDYIDLLDFEFDYENDSDEIDYVELADIKARKEIIED